MKNTKLAKINVTLLWSEAARALLCMLPMLLASGYGKTTYLVAIGQGGFFYSSLFLPKKTMQRCIMGTIILVLGLGVYLIGGTVAPNPFTAVLFTFLVCVMLSFLSGWKVGGPLALTLVMIYTAGLNAGSPTRAAQSFYVFGAILIWSALVSLLPIWRPLEPPVVPDGIKDEVLAEQGVRMGIGTSISLAVSYMAGFAKLGWAPSAVGNVVRYDQDLSRKRAWARFYGTVGGALLASLVIVLISSVTVMVWIGALFGVLNGLFKKTKIGMIPLFYTATIIILYTANDVASGKANIINRIMYNLVGIAIGMLVVIYPFPRLMKKLRK